MEANAGVIRCGLAIVMLAWGFAPSAQAEVGGTAAKPQGLRIEPRFPAGLRTTTITEGYAVIAWSTLPTGSVDDALVIDASHPEFGKSALEAIHRARPAVSSSALPQVQIGRFNFRRRTINNVDASEAMRPPRAPLNRTGDSPVEESATAALELRGDMLHVIPDELLDQAARGSVTVRFYVDAAGDVRVPSVSHATSVRLAVAALAYIRQWKFRPPRLHGREVIVAAERTFNLEARAALADAR